MPLIRFVGFVNYPFVEENFNLCGFCGVDVELSLRLCRQLINQTNVDYMIAAHIIASKGN